MEGRYQEAVECCRLNLAINPGSAAIRAYLANAYHWSGDHGQAILLYEDAKRLNPLYPVWYYPMSARASDAQGDEETALKAVRAGLQRQPDNFPCLLHLVSLLGRSGDIDEAKEKASRALLLSPGFNLRRVKQWLMVSDQAYAQKFSDGLKRAGFPE